MNLSNFKLFCDVVRYKSFSRGAAINGITQSAASQTINSLEREVGVQLIDRRKRPFILTAEGEIYYQGLCEILHQYETTKASIENLRNNVSGTVRVAAIYSIGLHDMNEVMQRFMTLYPKAKVCLEYQLPSKIYDAIVNEEADIGIVSYPVEDHDLSVIPLRSENMALVCHPEHHLARLETVSPDQLDGEDFVSFDRELAISRELERFFRKQNISVRKVMEFDNVETIKQAVEIGAGVTILPEPTVRRDAQRGTLAAITLQNCDMQRPIGIIYQHRKIFTPAITRFIELLQGKESKGQSARTAPARQSSTA
jgi:DNA-binding transcriptional LysR family regulator